MRSFFFSFLILSAVYGHACICSSLVPATKEIAEKYDVIFYGALDSVSKCGDEEKAIAYFTVSELYRGKTERQVKIYYDCSSECLMHFASGEQWLIYALYSKFDHLEVSICEHSRKKFSGEEQDLYLVDAKRSFEDELKFLKETFGIQAPAEPLILNNTVTDTGRHNTQPGGWGKVILLLVSLAVMGAVYFVTRRKK